MKLTSKQKFKTQIQLPGDKSLSHRCLILSALSNGESILENVSTGLDVVSTQNVLKKLGVKIQTDVSKLYVDGQGLQLKPNHPSPIQLDCGNAGTLMRLIAGVLSGQKEFSSVLTGDSSLMSRPMDRVADPLRVLGAHIELENKKAPVRIFPSELIGGEIYLESSSAQVKSTVMLASLYCKKPLALTLKHKTRDHTERLFPFYKIPIQIHNDQMHLQSCSQIQPVHYKIPCDPSAAAFWIVASLLSGHSIVMENVCLNPSRIGTIHILQKMGLSIFIEIKNDSFPEPVGSISVQPSDFDGFQILEDQIPFVIDEIPVLAVLATQAQNESVILGATELRYKETDRIVSIQKMFSALGLKINVESDTLKIPGRQKIKGGVVDSFHDHRIAMAAAIASTASEGPIEILNAESAAVSDPFFWSHFL